MRIILSFLALIVYQFAFAQAPPFMWEASVEHDAYASASSICHDEDNNIYVLGFNYLETPGDRYLKLSKFDPAGNLIWEREDTTLLMGVGLRRIMLGQDNHLYVCGALGVENSDIHLSKYDLEGELIWQRSYNGYGDDDDYILDMMIFDHHIYLTGIIRNPEGIREAILQRYDEEGNEIWTLVENFGVADEGDGFYAIANDGQDLIVTGYVNRNSSTDGSFLLARYNTEGENIWTKIEDIGQYDFDIGRDVAVDEEGSIYVTFNDSEYDCSKYSSEGDFQWGINAGPEFFGTPASFRYVEIGETGLIYISGYAGIPGGIDSVGAFLLTSVDKDGNIVFNISGTVAGTISDFTLKSSNEILALGILDVSSQREIFNFDTLGNINWRIPYEEDLASARCSRVMVDHDDNIIIAGGRIDSVLGYSDRHQLMKYGEGGLTIEAQVSANESCDGGTVTYTFLINNGSAVNIEGIQFVNELDAPATWASEPYELQNLEIESAAVMGQTTADLALQNIGANLSASFSIDVDLGDWDTEATFDNTARFYNIPQELNPESEFIEIECPEIAIGLTFDIESPSPLLLCHGENSVELNATDAEGQIPSWTSYGDGSFESATGESVAYTFGPEDVENGGTSIFVGSEICETGLDIELILLDPIIWDYNEDCNTETGEYTLVMMPTGGLPAWDAAASYQISGYYNDDALPAGESFTLIADGLANATVISFVATDAQACSAQADIEVYCQKMPVDLLSFTALAEEQHNLIQWQTANEIAIDYFLLERSIDGLNFDLLELVEARGSETVQSYSVFDRLIDIPQVYYRLAWPEGASLQYSNAIQIERRQESGKPSIHIRDQIIRISHSTAIQSCRLLDLQGRLQHFETFKNPNDIAINVSGLSPGIYLLQMDTGQSTYLEKLFLK